MITKYVEIFRLSTVETVTKNKWFMAWKALYRPVKQAYFSQQGEIESENHRFYTWWNSIRIGFP
ncbi:MAG: hypothetical protein J0I32_22640 [Sphingobacteriales bacterium]|nr:hypothetical protein [Sphingobacteriales bacterium]OJV98005.1 MAG: hypothetical protein BGO52_11235 [Sphingobacteriales bacterium 44-61]